MQGIRISSQNCIFLKPLVGSIIMIFLKSELAAWFQGKGPPFVFYYLGFILSMLHEIHIF